MTVEKGAAEDGSSREIVLDASRISSDFLVDYFWLELRPPMRHRARLFFKNSCSTSHEAPALSASPRAAFWRRGTPPTPALVRCQSFAQWAKTCVFAQRSPHRPSRHFFDPNNKNRAGSSENGFEKYPS